MQHSSEHDLLKQLRVFIDKLSELTSIVVVHAFASVVAGILLWIAWHRLNKLDTAIEALQAVAP